MEIEQLRLMWQMPQNVVWQFMLVMRKNEEFCGPNIVPQPAFFPRDVSLSNGRSYNSLQRRCVYRSHFSLEFLVMRIETNR